MNRRERVAVLTGLVAATALAGAVLLWPLELRHSAPFGFRLTFDRERGIAVRGGFVTATYDDFHRVDLDLRAYNRRASYDLTVHVRPDEPGASDVRTVTIGHAAERIWHVKSTFSAPFVTVRFPPISDSAGRRYYVWVEPGPRNRNDVVALWSIKSYSRATGRVALGALLADPPGDWAARSLRGGIAATLVLLVAVFGWLMAAVVALAFPATRPVGDGNAPPGGVR